MAFVTKTWKDRIVEFAGRRKLKNVSTDEEILYDVSRSEGTVMQAGDAFSAMNMNDLEQRIKTEFDNVNSSLGGLKFGIDSDGNYGYIKDGADTVTPFKSGITGYEILYTTKSASDLTNSSVKYTFTKDINVAFVSLSCGRHGTGARVYSVLTSNTGSLTDIFKQSQSSSEPTDNLNGIYVGMLQNIKAGDVIQFTNNLSVKACLWSLN